MRFLFRYSQGEPESSVKRGVHDFLCRAMTMREDEFFSSLAVGRGLGINKLKNTTTAY